MLSESLVGAIDLVLLMFVSTMAGALLVRAGLAVLGPRRRSGRQRPAETIARFPMSRLALWALMIAVVGVVVSLPVLASWQGHLAQHGQTVRNVYFVGVSYLPVLAVQAVPARVIWVNPASNEQTDLTQQRCLMYLGNSDGLTVFFDVRTGQSSRLPSSAIAYSLTRTFFVADECRVTEDELRLRWPSLACGGTPRQHTREREFLRSILAQERDPLRDVGIVHQ